MNLRILAPSILGLTGGILGIAQTLLLWYPTLSDPFFGPLWSWFLDLSLAVGLSGLIGALLYKFDFRLGAPVMFVGGLVPFGFMLWLGGWSVLTTGMNGLENFGWYAIFNLVFFWWAILILYGGYIATSRANKTIGRWRRDGWLP